MKPDPTCAPSVDLEADARYYQEIQTTFVARRGAPLTLSSADWTLARSWRRSGIPLRIVLRGIADAMAGHAESWQRDRKVYHLKFCSNAVKAAHQRWHAALASGGPQARGLPEHLAGLVQKLEAAQDLPASVGRERDRIVAELHAPGSAPRGTAELDRWLQSKERALSRAIRKELPVAEGAALDRDVEAGLTPYRSRMPEQVLNDVRDEAITRALLSLYGLPRLSLFHVE